MHGCVISVNEDPLKRDLLKISQHVRSVGRKGSLINQCFREALFIAVV
jgi:hypothetical protein